MGDIKTVAKTITVKAMPGLADSAEIVLPRAYLVQHSAQVVDVSELSLSIPTSSDARWMYLREWTPTLLIGDWVVVAAAAGSTTALKLPGRFPKARGSNISRSG